MAEKMTRKQFLSDVVAGVEMTDAHIAVAVAWIAALEKKSETPRVNRTAVENANAAKAVHAAIKAAGVEMVNARWIADNIAGVMTTQKAVGIARQGIKDGLLERVEEQGKAYYRAL